MRYWENMSSTEIGEVLGISAATARTRMFRGRAKLIELLAAAPTPAPERAGNEQDLDAWADQIRAQMS